MKPTRAVCFLLSITLGGCAAWRSIDGPMGLLNDVLACKLQPETLIVMLPGAYDVPQDFVDQGFVSAVRKQRIDADIQIVDAHIRYYTNQQIVKRLEDEVVAPAKAKGYKHLWFVGISLGGYGTLLYTAQNPSVVDGFFTMAPYMGTKDIPEDIERQGGLKRWSTQVTGNMDIDLWNSLKSYIDPPASFPQAFIGFGLSDRFALPNSLFAAVLPKGRSFPISGGHDWATWKQLWDQFLSLAPLPKISPSTAQCEVQ